MYPDQHQLTTLVNIALSCLTVLFVVGGGGGGGSWKLYSWKLPACEELEL